MNQLEEDNKNKEKEDLVSIIMPVYNCQNFIGEAIQSIQQQSYENWELIIIDDGSTDNGMKIAKEKIKEKVKIIELTKNIGPANARNIGLEQSKGKYIAYIDADDYWMVNKLEKQIKWMKEQQIAFSFSAYERISPNGNIKNKVKVPEQLEYKEALRNTIILTSTVIMDTDKIDKKMMYMPDMKITEDTATWFCILRSGIVAHGNNEILVKYRVRRNSLSSHKFRSAYQLWKVYKEYEKLNLLERIRNIVGYGKNALVKRKKIIHKEIF